MKPLVIRLTRNQKLRESLVEYCRSQGITAAAVAACAGSVLHARVRLADGETVRDFPGEREIVSLSGTISADGPHLHISLSDKEGAVIGGHLSEGTLVNTTAEIVLLDLTADYQLTREMDPETGYAELIIKAK